MTRISRPLLVAALVLASCGGGAAPQERGLTQDEADRLAAVLFTNHESKGATFQLATSFTATGDTLSMSGEVDWVNHQGHAMVNASGQENGVTEVFWSQSTIVERRPRLDPLFAATGRAGVLYVARQPDTRTRQLDRAVSVLVGLASTVRDNGVLIMQKEGSAFMRNDTLRGAPVEVLRYGTQNRYWLDVGTSTMRRFDGNAAAGSAPIVIDVLESGERRISPPPAGLVVPYGQVKELYDSDLSR